MKSMKNFLPIIIAILIAILPAPSGLDDYAWRYFAVFIGVVVGLVLEPLPGAVVGLIGVVVVALLNHWALFPADKLADPHFKAAKTAFSWAVSGFTNGTVWLIFGAFMFALGYEKTGLGRRIALWLVKTMGKRSLTLGYAIMIADTVLAPFTPSNTARSGGTIFPVIRNLPPLYDSNPDDESRKRIGTYLMWTAIASTCVTSSLFLTALAPNLLAVALTQSSTGILIGWGDWFMAAAPVCILLLILVPLLSYWLCPPQVKSGTAVSEWAAQELTHMGRLTRNELLLLCFVVMALLMWIFAGQYIAGALVGLLVISLMLVTRIVTWDDILANKSAWNTLVWFATLVALAGGLSKVGFVSWFGQLVGSHISGLNATLAMIILAVIFFVLHYLFASVTAHTTALLPVILAAASGIPGIHMEMFVFVLVPMLGLMGIITPYGTGPSPVYYGSGFIPGSTWWKLGAVFGLLYLVVWLGLGLPWLEIVFS
ncbi:anion permease [Celerinatantimonas sp. YJH-8]|uniref:anion permease n=1 Tax=Celerinatantimonas sp. YJH-8 TaxID=3228714 RepID=UPI0038BF7827